MFPRCREREAEEQAFPLLFKAATGKRLQSAGIALICGKGNHGALKVAEFLIENNRAVAFIVDKDSAGLTVFKPEELRHIGVKDEQIHFVGSPNELEELFSDQQWVDTAGRGLGAK
jgi:putative ATP-dependent endonuclease of the OLD family